MVKTALSVGHVMVHDEYPGEGDCVLSAVIVVLVGEPATTHPAAVHALVVDAVQVFSGAEIENTPSLVGQVMVQDEYPVAADCVPRTVTLVPVAVPATTQPALVHALVVDAVHVFSMHVCADPEAAVADMVYPALQLLQSTVAVSHSVPPNPVAKVGVPPGQVQVLAAHVGLLKVPLVLQVAVPLPLYPELQLTATVSPVLPIRKKEREEK